MMRIKRVDKGYYTFKNYYIFRWKGPKKIWWNVGLESEGEFDVSLEGFPSLREARGYIMTREGLK